MNTEIVWNMTMAALEDAEKWKTTTTELWPLWVWTCVGMVFTTASAWMIWVYMSVLMSILQSLYTSYQFIMIILDLVGLSLLKTYAWLGRLALFFLALGGKLVGISSLFAKYGRKSRREEWKQQLEQVSNYEGFLKIPVEEKAIATKAQQQYNKQQQKPDDDKHTNEQHSDGVYDQQHAIIAEELGSTAAELLRTTTTRLEEARAAAMEQPWDNAAASDFKYILSSLLKRNHLTLEDILAEQSRPLAESGQYGLSAATRERIEAYYQQVEAGLKWIAESPVSICSSETASLAATAMTAETTISKAKSMNSMPLKPTVPDDKESRDGAAIDHISNVTSTMSLQEVAKNKTASSLSATPQVRASELHDRIMLVRKMKHNMGRTALMLSGGGSQTMYHLGLIRSLIDAKLYQHIPVVTGSSGGSIVAALCAMNTSEELMEHVCVPHVSTDYKKTGEQSRRNIRWFPPLLEMGRRWLNREFLVGSKEFRDTCEFYYSDVTFEEAFQRTGKHVCISVSAGRANGRTVQRLLLNHISTPHVTLASAVAASCAVPGVMAPAKLMCKNSVTGNVEPFEVDGVEWIDGSIQADLPFKRISTMFNVSNYVVCQTNFFVLPFINQSSSPSVRSIHWRMLESLEWDLRNRCKVLSRLGLFPNLYGQDISRLFDQQFYGNLTIVPSFTTLQSVGLRMLSNPDVQDMERYLKYGQIAAWPHMGVIRDMIRLEKALDETLLRLEERYRVMYPVWATPSVVGRVPSSVGLDDDAYSIASASASTELDFHSFAMGPAFSTAGDTQTEVMAQLQQENDSLKKELEDLTRKLTEMIATGQINVA